MTITEPLPARLRAKRSRSGCLSCRKLKIKCNEGKPECEYCTHTNKSCFYPPPKSSASRITKKASPPKSISTIIKNHNKMHLLNKQVREINSYKNQLNISDFELKLLKDYLNFGGSLFSLNKNDKVFKFWSFEVPSLFTKTELMRNAIFALSGIQLLSQFEEASMSNVCVSDVDESLVVYQDPDLIRGESVYSRTNAYFKRANEIMLEMLSNESTINDVFISGQILAVNSIIFVYAIIHPISPLPLISFDGSHSDLIQICLNLQKAFYTRGPTIKGTFFESLWFTDDRKYFLTDDDDDDVKFTLIEHLKDYIDKNVDMLDPRHIIYYGAVSTMELGFYRSVKSGYLLPTYRIIINILRDREFVKLLRKGDYISLKFIFNLSCVCSAGHFKFSVNSYSVWDSFIPVFQSLAFAKFGDKFEDGFDQCLFETAKNSVSSSESYFPVNLLTVIGSKEIGW